MGETSCIASADLTEHRSSFTRQADETLEDNAQVESADKQALFPAQELSDQSLRDFLKKCEASTAQTMKSPV